MQSTNNSYLLYSHHTLVPIGANFQVNVPPIMDYMSYKYKSTEAMKTLKILKLHDPA